MKQGTQRVTKPAVRRSAPPPRKVPHSDALDRASSDGFVRGYVAAVAEFARRETTPKRVLAAANVTRAFAVACGVNPYDMKPLRGQFASSKPRTLR